MLVLALALAAALSGCGDDDGYTVWTLSVPYSDYQAAFATMGEGQSLDLPSSGSRVHFEIPSSVWNDEIRPILGNNGKQNWSEGQIKNWLTGNGLSDSEANQEATWITTVSHGFFATRDGSSMAHLLLK